MITILGTDTYYHSIAPSRITMVSEGATATTIHTDAGMVETNETRENVLLKIQNSITFYSSVLNPPQEEL